MKKQVARRYLHKQQQQKHLWPQVCETTDGDHFNSTQMKIASVSVLRHTSVAVDADADVDLDLDSDFGFAIVADCVVNNSFTKYIYTVFLQSNR